MWLILSLAAAMLWGLNYVLVEHAVRRVSPFTVVWAELLVSLPLVYGAAMVSGRISPDIVTIQTDARAKTLVLASVATFLAASI